MKRLTPYLLLVSIVAGVITCLCQALPVQKAHNIHKSEYQGENSPAEHTTRFLRPVVSPENLNIRERKSDDLKQYLSARTLYYPESPGERKGYYTFSFTGPIRPAWRAEIVRRGACLTGLYLPPNTLIIHWEGSTAAFQDLESLPFIKQCDHYHPTRKISAHIGEAPYDGTKCDGEDRLPLLLTLFPGARVDCTLTALESLSIEPKVLGALPRPDGQEQAIIMLKCLPEQIPALAFIDEVLFIEERPSVLAFNSLSASGLLQAGGGRDSLIQDGTVTEDDYPIWQKYGLHGQRQVIALWDTGIDYGHEGFAEPVELRLKNWLYSPKVPYAALHDGTQDPCDEDNGHGTAVASAAAMDVNANDVMPYSEMLVSSGDYGDAIAHEAQIIIGTVGGYSVFDPVKQFQQWRDLSDHCACVLITATHWRSGVSSEYTSQSHLLDITAWLNRQMAIVNAVGNGGSCYSSNDHFDPNFAKNPIDVGTTDDLSAYNDMAQVVAPFNMISKRGLNFEGSLTPDLVTVGADSSQAGINNRGVIVNSASGDCNITGTFVGIFGGSSAAAGEIGGAVALVHQYFEEGYYPGLRDASGALMKAMLINSAQRLTGYCTDSGQRPGFAQGWGRPQLDQVMVFPGDSRGLLVYDIPQNTGFTTPDDNFTFHFEVTDLNQSLRVTLVYTDEPAVIGSTGPVLVNDLDLELLGPTNVRFYGNHFATSGPYTGYSISAPTPIWDNRNAVENVFLTPSQIVSLGTGVYQVRVRASNIPNGSAQGFAVVVSGGIQQQPNVFFDSETYFCEGNFSLQVVEPKGLAPVAVLVRNLTNGDTEIVYCTGKRPVFHGIMPFGQGRAIVGNHLLEVNHEDKLVATFQHGTTYAEIDCRLDVCLQGYSTSENGDHDLWFDACETGTMTLTLANNERLRTAPGTWARLRTQSPGLRLLNDISYFGDIPPEETSKPRGDGFDDPFTFYVDLNRSCGERVSFNVEIGGQGWASSSCGEYNLVFVLNHDRSIAPFRQFSFESGLEGWVLSAGNLIPNNQCGYVYHNEWHRSGERASDGNWSLHCGVSGGQYSPLDDSGICSPVLHIPHDGAILSLKYWAECEISNGHGFDGMVVEVSRDGVDWQYLLPYTGYSDTIPYNTCIYGFPFSYPAFFTGDGLGTIYTDDTWSQEACFSLLDYADENIQVRLRFGSDNLVGGEGIYIDEVRLWEIACERTVDCPTQTPSPSPTFTATDTPLETATPSGSETSTPIATLTATQSPVYTETATPMMTFSPTELPTETPIGPLEPLLKPEPPFTKGLCNVIRLTPQASRALLKFKYETALSYDFSDIVSSSNWIQETNFSFCQLQDGCTFYYRARAMDDQFRESGWSNIVFSCQDNTPPQTDVVDFNPPFTYSGTITIEVTAQDTTSLVTQIDLYYRNHGRSWKYAQTLFPGEVYIFDLNAAGGFGVYDFYSIGTDVVGNRETAPLMPDAWIEYVPTPSPTQTPTTTPTPTDTSVHTQTPSPTQTETPSPTQDITETVTASPTPTRTVTPTETPTQTESPAPTYSPTVAPTYTLTRTPTPTSGPTKTPAHRAYLISGYMNTRLNRHHLSTLNLVTFVFNRIVPVSRVEIYYQGAATGVYLCDDGRSGDFGAGDDVYGLLTTIENPEPVTVLLEIIAENEIGAVSDPWPYFVVD